MQALFVYPFLREIPESDLVRLDLQVLALPGQAELELLRQLSAAINKNLVVYQAGHEAKGGHLCRYLKFATLSPPELQLLQEAELKFGPGLVVVAYEKPLVFNGNVFCEPKSQMSMDNVNEPR